MHLNQEQMMKALRSRMWIANTHTRMVTGLLLGAFLITLSTRPAFGDLIAHWNFNEGHGTLLHDAVGGVTGTITGCHTWIAGDGANDGANTCLELQWGGPEDVDGGGYVDVGMAPQFVFGNAPFSVAAWVRMCDRECPVEPSSVASAFPVSRCHSFVGAVANGYILGVNEFARNGVCEKAYFYVTGHSDVPGSAAVVTDQSWHLLVGVGTASEAMIYVDDHPPVSMPRSPMELYNETKLIFGGISTNNPDGAAGGYFGLIDDVRIWNHALTPAEINSLYLANRPVNPPPLGCNPCGACCFFATQDCDVLTEAACIAAGGAYLDDNTPCDPDTCAAVTSILDPEPVALLQTYAIGPPVPNPFTSGTSTYMTYEVPASSEVEIAIYDVSGRMIRSLVHNTFPAGRHLIEWNGRDDTGRAVGNGVYFYSMRAGSFQSQRRIVVLK